MTQHSLIVYFEYGLDDTDPMHDLGDRLNEAVEEAGVGAYDGHEIADSLAKGSFYLYGPDADALFAVVAPILRESPLACGAEIRLRYGDVLDDSAREERLGLSRLH